MGFSSLPCLPPPSFFHRCRNFFCLSRATVQPLRGQLAPRGSAAGGRRLRARAASMQRSPAASGLSAPKRGCLGLRPCPAAARGGVQGGENNFFILEIKKPKPTQNREERDKSNNRRGGGRRSELRCRHGWVHAAWHGQRVPAGTTGGDHAGNPPRSLPPTFSWRPGRWRPWGRVAAAWHCRPPRRDSQLVCLAGAAAQE